jgi:hypothetical protein
VPKPAVDDDGGEHPNQLRQDEGQRPGRRNAGKRIGGCDGRGIIGSNRAAPPIYSKPQKTGFAEGSDGLQ